MAALSLTLPPRMLQLELLFDLLVRGQLCRDLLPPRLPVAVLLPPSPQLCVLDLDQCVWSPEMYELYEVPKPGECEIRGDLNGRGEGVTGVRSGGEVIRLFPGALLGLQEVADGKFET